MTVKKLITYPRVDPTGNPLESTEVFQVTVSDRVGNYLLHKDLLRHWSSQRQGTVSTKTRKEVRGGGRKPWRQKGTGKARAGSNRSPLWKGGGVIFGPKPRRVSLKVNQKERQLALQTLLYNKQKQWRIVPAWEEVLAEPKTKLFVKFCDACGIPVTEKMLVLVVQKTPLLKRATRNLSNVELLSVDHLNTWSLLQAKHILCTDSAIHYLKERYGN